MNVCVHVLTRIEYAHLSSYDFLLEDCGADARDFHCAFVSEQE